MLPPLESPDNDVEGRGANTGDDDVAVTELQQLITRLHPKARPTAAKDFIAADELLEVAVPLDTQTIVSLVKTTEDTPIPSSVNEQEADDNDMKPRVVTRKDARKDLQDAIAFYEQKGNATILDHLWSALRDLDTVELQQVLILSFFNKE